MTRNGPAVVPPLDPALAAEIDALDRELEPVIRRHPRDADRHLAAFETRRIGLLSRLLGRRPTSSITPLHVLGDSHSAFFSGSNRLLFLHFARTGVLRPHWINRGVDLLPCFRSYHLGPSTAWMAAQPESSTQTRHKVERMLSHHLPAGAPVMLCFGEIDCRFQMPKAALAGQSVAKLTAATAERFMHLPRRVRELGFAASVWGVAQVSPRPENDPDAAWPAVGPAELRLEITYQYNRALAALCDREAFPFSAIAGTFHPPSEPMPEHCFIDGVHLSQAVMPHALRLLCEAGILDF